MPESDVLQEVRRKATWANQKRKNRRVLESLRPLDTFTAQQIQALREEHGVSQAVFAACLNVSVSTLQKWERGENAPAGPALKLLNLVNRRDLDLLIY